MCTRNPFFESVIYPHICHRTLIWSWCCGPSSAGEATWPSSCGSAATRRCVLPWWPPACTKPCGSLLGRRTRTYAKNTSCRRRCFRTLQKRWDFASFEDFFKCRWFLRLGLFVNLTLTSELEVIMKFLIFPAPVIEFSAKFPDLNQLLASNPSKYFLKNTKSFLLTQLPLHRHNVFPASCWTCVTKQTRPMPWASSSGGTPGGANWPASSWPTSPTTSSSLRPRAPRRPSSSTGGEAWRRHPILLLLSRTSFPYLYFGRNSSSECLVWFTLMIEGDK